MMHGISLQPIAKGEPLSTLTHAEVTKVLTALNACPRGKKIFLRWARKYGPKEAYMRATKMFDDPLDNLTAWDVWYIISWLYYHTGRPLNYYPSNTRFRTSKAFLRAFSWEKVSARAKKLLKTWKGEILVR
jgi:hypothetical protein